jgi:hypothetical protein
MYKDWLRATVMGNHSWSGCVHLRRVRCLSTVKLTVAASRKSSQSVPCCFILQGVQLKTKYNCMASLAALLSSNNIYKAYNI